MRLYVDHAFMLKTVLSSLYFLLFVAGLTAQNIPLDAWRTHFSYQQVKLLIEANDKIFCAAENGLFYYNLQDQSINKLTKINGLSDVGISAMAYHQPSNMLVIGYGAGGIDLITEAGTTTIRDFKDTDLVEDKEIKNIQFWNADILVATSLGVIVISMSAQEITENFRSIGLNGSDVSVTDLFVEGDNLWTITNQGIQVGSLNNNLLDFNNWTLFEGTRNQKNSFFGKAGDKVYSIKNDTILMTFDNNSWTESGIIVPEDAVAMQTSDELLIGTNASLFRFDGSQLDSVIFNGPYELNNFLFTDELWLGTKGNGLVRHGSGESVFPKGPIRDQPTNVVAEQGKIYLFYGPDPESYSGESDQLGFNTFDGYSWAYQTIEGFYNLSDIAYWNDKRYISSIGYGIYSFEDKSIMNHFNSSLTDSKVSLGPLITDLEASSVFWIASYNNVNPIASMDQKGDLVTFQESVVGTDRPEKIFSTAPGDGPILIQNALGEGGGFITFEPPNEQARFSLSNGLPSNNIRALTVDLEDVAWVGTNQGLITFPDASFLPEFAQPVNATFENNLLFEKDEIYALTFDGGNRIWIATKEGLWVFNANFTALDHFFNVENSPLPSNEVHQLTYNPENGEMYIQTAKGLVSFRSGSSAGKENYDEVSIFPNPVRPGYTGLVGISGLRYDTFVKITNIDGKLIRELKTNGGTASWDLLDYNNQKVNSGIYVVFTSTSDGREKYVGKIAVVN
ncbi:MAG: hypothetical protein RID25_09095 [Cyclobacteriaceae bacterium]